MRDAHETARARDAYRTRTHAINPDAGEFTRLDQEDTMPSPTQRRHELLVALLTEIRDRLPERVEAISGRIAIPHPSLSLEITSDGISPDLYEILTGSAMPAADITEEPPVSSHIICGVCGERPDSLLGHVGCGASAPDHLHIERASCDREDLIRARDAEVRADADRRIHALQLEMAEGKARRNAEIDRLGRLLHEREGLQWESTGDNRHGQPTGRWVGPIEVGEP